MTYESGIPHGEFLFQGSIFRGIFATFRDFFLSFFFRIAICGSHAGNIFEGVNNFRTKIIRTVGPSLETARN